MIPSMWQVLQMFLLTITNDIKYIIDNIIKPLGHRRR